MIGQYIIIAHFPFFGSSAAAYTYRHGIEYLVAACQTGAPRITAAAEEQQLRSGGSYDDPGKQQSPRQSVASPFCAATFAREGGGACATAPSWRERSDPFFSAGGAATKTTVVVIAAALFQPVVSEKF